MKFVTIDLMLSENQCEFIKEKCKSQKLELRDYAKLLLLTDKYRYYWSMYEDDGLMEWIESKQFI